MKRTRGTMYVISLDPSKHVPLDSCSMQRATVKDLEHKREVGKKTKSGDAKLRKAAKAAKKVRQPQKIQFLQYFSDIAL